MREELTNAVKTAMKAQDKVRLGALRMVQAAIQDRDIAQRGAGKDPLINDEIATLLLKMIKQRQDSIAMYNSGGRPELAQKEQLEIDVITGFLPQQLSEDAIRTACKNVIAELGANSPRDMGKCMAMLKEKYAGQMDFVIASAIVKALLSS